MTSSLRKKERKMKTRFVYRLTSDRSIPRDFTTMMSPLSFPLQSFFPSHRPSFQTSKSLSRAECVFSSAVSLLSFFFPLERVKGKGSSRRPPQVERASEGSFNSLSLSLSRFVIFLACIVISPGVLSMKTSKEENEGAPASLSLRRRSSQLKLPGRELLSVSVRSSPCSKEIVQVFRWLTEKSFFFPLAWSSHPFFFLEK